MAPRSRSSKDKRDIYYRLHKSLNYRARSAFKLLHLDDEFRFLEHVPGDNSGRRVQRAVDLCAAPGSWSQVLVQRLNADLPPDAEPAKVVAVDLQPMAPLAGVHTILGDITSESTRLSILSHFSNLKADLVVCDGAPDVTGLHALDAHLHASLLLAAFGITRRILAPGGTAIYKIFVVPGDERCELLLAQARLLWADVRVRKPRSSRAGSAEHFLVCRDFLPSAEDGDAPPPLVEVSWKGAVEGFIECGDLSAFNPPA